MLPLATNIWELLREKSFRHLFAETAFDRLLAKQIREIRLARGWTPTELARRSGLSLATIVRYEVTCKGAQIRKLQALARAFDCALIIRFVSWGEFFIMICAEKVCVVPSFDEEERAIAEREARS